MAVQAECDRIVVALLLNGADPDIKNFNGDDAIDVARKIENEIVREVIIELISDDLEDPEPQSGGVSPKGVSHCL